MDIGSKIYEILDKILNSLSKKSEIVVGSKTSSQISQAASAGVQTIINVSKDGYTPIGIAGIRLGWISGQTNRINIYCFDLSGNNARVDTFNMHTAVSTYTITVYVLYKKN